MERRSKRVSSSQWDIALDFFHRNPNLLRGYCNSSRARELSKRLWQELTNLLNAEGSGATKALKEWATYFNNYKSKLKKMVSDQTSDATATGGGPPRAMNLTDLEERFLAIMGSGFGQGAPNVRVNPFPDMDIIQQIPASPDLQPEQELIIGEMDLEIEQPLPSTSATQEGGVSTSPMPLPAASQDPPVIAPPTLPIQTRRTRRYRSRPMAPIDEARRILSEVEMHRAAADLEHARALQLIGLNLGRLADIAEKYLQNSTP